MKHYRFKNIASAPGVLQREGIDHDPIKPGMWATLPLHPTCVLIASWPIPAEGDPANVMNRDATIMLMMDVDDPTTMREIPLRMVAVFKPSRVGNDPELAYAPDTFTSKNTA